MIKSISFDDIYSHEDVIQYFKEGEITHTILTGPPGIGKTSIIHAYLNSRGYVRTSEFQQTMFFNNVLELNSANDRSYNVVMNKIRDFIKASVGDKQKILIMEEIDTLIETTQRGISLFMDPLICPSNFIILATCNNKDQIHPSLQRRFKMFDMNYPDRKYAINNLKNICKKRGISFVDEDIESIYNQVGGDIRRAISYIDIYNLDNKLNVCGGGGETLVEEIERRFMDASFKDIDHWMLDEGIRAETIMRVAEKIFSAHPTQFSILAKYYIKDGGRFLSHHQIYVMMDEINESFLSS